MGGLGREADELTPVVWFWLLRRNVSFGCGCRMLSCKIAWEYFRIITMACQARTIVQQRVMLLPSYFASKSLSRWLGAWPVIFGIAPLVMLFYLFNVLCVRRVWTQESLAQRVTASAAFLLVVEEFLEEKLEWMLVFQF